MSIAVKLILAALLIGCWFDMPYGYYQFVRIACTLGFVYLGIKEASNNNTPAIIFCFGCAALLNPIIKVHFIRHTWNIIDAIIAGILIIWSIFEMYGKVSKKETNQPPSIH